MARQYHPMECQEQVAIPVDSGRELRPETDRVLYQLPHSDIDELLQGSGDKKRQLTRKKLLIAASAGMAALLVTGCVSLTVHNVWSSSRLARSSKALRFFEAGNQNKCSALWKQCGGMTADGSPWDGSHCCEDGATCVTQSKYFRQCIPAKKESEKCGDAEQGDPCHIAVSWAMTSGIYSHPDYYPAGLSPQSEFKEFQEALHWQKVHMGKKVSCKKPCGPGRCDFVFRWEGCESKREWDCDPDQDDGSLAFHCCCNKYHNETKKQLLLAEPGSETKSKGAASDEHAVAPASDKPTLFCVSLMMPVGYEVGLLRAQLAKGHLGIFGCDDWAVFSNRSIRLTPEDEKPAHHSIIIKSNLSAPIGGQYHTAMNTHVFITFWDKVMDDKRSQTNDWTVKLDPDAVFLPGRLQELLSSDAGGLEGPGPEAGRYLNNCPLGLHGPIEVVSKAALKTYRENPDKCVKGHPGEHGQEDWYFRSCMKALGVQKVDAFNVLFEGMWACHERPSSWQPARPPCFAPQVSFHPFKTFESYFHCFEEANGRVFDKPLVPISDAPSAANQRHG